MKNSTFWDIKPCSLLKVNDVSEQNVASIFRVEGKTCYLFHVSFLLRVLLNHEDGGYIFLEMRMTLNGLHGHFIPEDRSLYSDILVSEDTITIS
jgi:hypothetical protein